MKRGEIRWYGFRAPDKRRPVVVLTRDSVIGYLGEITVAPVTTTIRDIPTEVLLGPDEGMPQACAVNCDHLQTVAKGKIGGLITALSTAKLQAVSEAVRFALDLK
jgi:mRNA interferase MazF